MKIGILLCGHVPDSLRGDLGDYDAMFARLLHGHGFTFETYAVVDGHFPDGPAACDGWLVTGSRHGAYEPHDWIPPLEDLIRRIRASTRPLVGICFGHQIIAQALGGTVEKFAGGWSVGHQLYRFGNETMALNAWHQDQVTQLPPDAEVRGESDFCRYAALSYGDDILTVQAHPEFDRPMMEGLIRDRGRGVVPDDQLDAAAEDLERPTASGAIADRLAAVLKGARA